MTNKLYALGTALAVAIIAFSSSAWADESQAARIPEGSWLISTSPPAPVGVITFTRDGAVLGSRPPVVLPGAGPEFVSTGHGTWMQKANREITSTVLYLRSSLTAEFTGITKVITTVSVMGKSDELSGTSIVEVHLADGTLLVSFQLPVRMTRIIAGN